MDWWKRAACAGQHTLFCPADDDEVHEPEDRRVRERRNAKLLDDARRICAHCPVRQECVDDAITNPALDDGHTGFPGIWGGYRKPDLLKIRKVVYGYLH